MEGLGSTSKLTTQPIAKKLRSGKGNTSQMNKNRNPIDGTNMHKSGILFVKIHESEIPIHKLEKIDCQYLINLSKFSH